MDRGRPGIDLPQTSSKKRRRHRKGAPDDVAENSGMLRLASTGTTIAPALFLARPLLAELVSADTCWQMAVADWRARRPPRWQFARYGAWTRESIELLAKRDRIRESAVELGVCRSF